MLTISLDEAGSFDSGMKAEKKNGSKTTLIGGIVFDDKNVEGEVARERQRIEAYYKRVVKAVCDGGIQAQFPTDLHRGSNTDNSAKEGAVKNHVSRTLAQFIQKGTYKDQILERKGKPLPEREGVYYICAIVKSSRGKSELMKTELGDFFRDGCASNIYFHMVSEAVEHFIFHTPLCPDEEQFRLDIATRMSNDISDQASIDLYKGQGFENKAKGRKGASAAPAGSLGAALSQAGFLPSEHYQLMNADIFRSVLTEQMLSCERKKIQIDSFYVAPIKYKYVNDGNKNILEHEEQIFLFLADSVCTYLTHQIGSDDTREVLKRAEALSGERTLVFAYDEADEHLKKALRALEAKKYITALKETYQISKGKTKEAKIYTEKWIPFVEDKIIRMVKEDERSRERTSPVFEVALELRNLYLSNRTDIGELFYSFGILQKACEDFDDSYGYDEIRYYLNDIGLCAYCHKGEPKKAEEYFEKCLKYSGAVKIEDYINTRNQYATALGDLFQYEKAIEVINETLQLSEKLVDLSKRYVGSERELFGVQVLGQSCSQAGQFAAFLGDAESAVTYFDKAIGLFGENTQSIKRTDSYRLHALIDAGDKEAYRKGIVGYTGTFSDPAAQLKNMQKAVEEGLLKIEYALYLYLKGLYFFGDTEEIGFGWRDITAYIDSMNKADEHPWELIYKYLCLIAHRMSDTDAEVKYKNALARLFNKWQENKEDHLLQIITLSNLAYIYEIQGDDENAMKYYRAAYGQLKKHFPMAVAGEKVSGEEDKKDVVVRKLRYMYC